MISRHWAGSKHFEGKGRLRRIRCAPFVSISKDADKPGVDDELFSEEDLGLLLGKDSVGGGISSCSAFTPIDFRCKYIHIANSN